MTLSTSPQNALTRGARTPPDLKWLLNERAALAGAVESAVARQALLAARLQQAERERLKLTAALAGSERALGRSKATIAALDATIHMAYAQVEPSAGGVVNAWAGKYGKRGGLREYLAQVVRDAAPTPVTLALAINLAVHRFGLVFAIPEDRQRFRYPVRNTLRGLAKDALIEPVRCAQGYGAAVAWRWKQLPTIAELVVLAAQAGVAIVPAPAPAPGATSTAGEPARKAGRDAAGNAGMPVGRKAASDGRPSGADAYTP